MNIEELARKAGGTYMLCDGIDEEVEVFRRVELYRFAALVKAEVLEQAAQKCENHPDGLNMIGGAFVICAEAIRAMKPNTPISGGTPAA
mgnify:CR=1 FL=1